MGRFIKIKMEINEKLLLVHNTRHASPRHRRIGRDTNSTSPWISRFDLIIDTYLDWKPGMPSMKKVKTEKREPLFFEKLAVQELEQLLIVMEYPLFFLFLEPEEFRLKLQKIVTHYKLLEKNLG